MREEQFKMERKGLVEEGQEVQVTERVNGSLYSYIVEPSVAMSGIYRSNQTKELSIRSKRPNGDFTLLWDLTNNRKGVSKRANVIKLK